jgi:hypothetical protein
MPKPIQTHEKSNTKQQYQQRTKVLSQGLQVQGSTWPSTSFSRTNDVVLHPPLDIIYHGLELSHSKVPQEFPQKVSKNGEKSSHGISL